MVEKLSDETIKFLADYSWWKDGHLYVGCGMETYGKALVDCEPLVTSFQEREEMDDGWY